MKTSILKKATLTNKGLWTTTITWATILDGTTTKAKTCIIVKQECKKTMKVHSYTRIEIFEHHEFDKAYDEFHKKIANWI